MSLRNRISQGLSTVRAGLNTGWATATDAFNRTVGQISVTLTGIINGTTVVGMNVESIDTYMKPQVRDSVERLNGILDGFASVTESQSKMAFSGNYRAAVDNYIESTRLATRTMVSHLLEINDKLDQIGTNYVQRDMSVAEAVGGTATEVASAAEENKYVEAEVGVQGWDGNR